MLMFWDCLQFDYIIYNILVIQYNYIKISYFFDFLFSFGKGVTRKVKQLKQFNSLDDRGIFCTEVVAGDPVTSSFSSHHVHDNIEIIYSVDADIEIKTDIEKLLISKGELAVISPMERHSQTVIGSGRYYSIKFLPSILFSSDRIFSEYKFFNRFVSRDGEKRHYSKKELEGIDTSSVFDDIMWEWTKKDSGYELMIRANILKIFTFLARCDEATLKKSKSKSSNEAIDTALSYIAENSATVTEQEAAERCGLSLAYFSTLFKNTVGQKFGEYLMQLKIGRAKNLLLTTDKSITYIAYETGFSSSSHFIARFREIENTTPAQYRRKAQKEGSVSRMKASALTIRFEHVGEESGHLLILKYRTNRIDDPPWLPLFLCTERRHPISNDLSWTMVKSDEQWHVIIMDVNRSKQYVKNFVPSPDGKFYGSHVHFHLFYKTRSPDQYFDLAYVAYADSLERALEIIGEGEEVSLGYFEDDGPSRWIELPLKHPSHIPKRNIPTKFYRGASGIFNDAAANGISLRKIELLHEDDVEFLRVWCP